MALTYNQLYQAYVDMSDTYHGAQIDLEALKQAMLEAITACQERSSMQAISVLTRALLDCADGYPAPNEGSAVEQLLNGGFNDGTGWTLDDASITITGGKAVFAGLGSGLYLRQTVNLQANAVYEFSFDLVTCTAGSIQFTLNNGTEGLMRNVAGHFTVRHNIGPTPATEARFGRGDGAYIPESFSGSIDNCSIIGPI